MNWIISTVLTIIQQLASSILYSIPFYWMWNSALVLAVTSVREISWVTAFGMVILIDIVASRFAPENRTTF